MQQKSFLQSASPVYNVETLAPTSKGLLDQLSMQETKRNLICDLFSLYIKLPW